MVAMPIENAHEQGFRVPSEAFVRTDGVLVGFVFCFRVESPQTRKRVPHAVPRARQWHGANAARGDDAGGEGGGGQGAFIGEEGPEVGREFDSGDRSRCSRRLVLAREFAGGFARGDAVEDGGGGSGRDAAHCVRVGGGGSERGVSGGLFLFFVWGGSVSPRPRTRRLWLCRRPSQQGLCVSGGSGQARAGGVERCASRNGGAKEHVLAPPSRPPLPPAFPTPLPLTLARSSCGHVEGEVGRVSLGARQERSAPQRGAPFFPSRSSRGVTTKAAKRKPRTWPRGRERGPPPPPHTPPVHTHI